MALSILLFCRPECSAQARSVAFRALAQIHSHPAPKGCAAEASEGATTNSPVQPVPGQDHSCEAIQAAGEVPPRVPSGQEAALEEAGRGQGQGQGS